MYCIDHAVLRTGGTLRADLPTIEIPAEGRTWRLRNVSHTLVSGNRATRRVYFEIGDARAHDPHVDTHSRRHRIGSRRRRYPHSFSLEKRKISSRWPHLLNTGRHRDSLH